MNDEELFTFLTIVERILNDRPLTSVGNDPKDLQALSPSALLLGRLDSEIGHIYRIGRVSSIMADS